MKRDSFVMLRSFVDGIAEMESDADKLAAYEAIMAYCFDGEEPDRSKPEVVRVMFKAILPVMKKALDSYDSKKENGAKGGRPKKSDANQHGSEIKLEKPKKTESKPNETLNKDLDLDKDIKEKETSKKENDQVAEVIEFLNGVCGTNYKPTTEATRKNINGRLNEGYTVDDLKNVISKKSDEWKGTEWEKYLSPYTLFRPANFEKYYNQKVVVQKPKQYGFGKIIEHDYNFDDLEKRLLNRGNTS